MLAQNEDSNNYFANLNYCWDTRVLRIPLSNRNQETWKPMRNQSPLWLQVPLWLFGLAMGSPWGFSGWGSCVIGLDFEFPSPYMPFMLEGSLPYPALTLITQISLWIQVSLWLFGLAMGSPWGFSGWGSCVIGLDLEFPSPYMPFMLEGTLSYSALALITRVSLWIQVPLWLFGLAMGSPWGFSGWGSCVIGLNFEFPSPYMPFMLEGSLSYPALTLITQISLWIQVSLWLFRLAMGSPWGFSGWGSCVIGLNFEFPSPYMPFLLEGSLSCHALTLIAQIACRPSGFCIPLLDTWVPSAFQCLGSILSFQSVCWSLHFVFQSIFSKMEHRDVWIDTAKQLFLYNSSEIWETTKSLHNHLSSWFSWIEEVKAWDLFL